ncbi:MAG: MIP/aquaporin family protein [Gemmatimonadales bacterium]
MAGEMMKRAVAEAIGTFALTFIGVLSISGAGIAGAPALVNLTSVALAHGFTIAVMVAALGAISGGHFNPAVTFGFVITGRMRASAGLTYGVAQLAGAVVAGLLLTALFGGPAVRAGTPDLARDIGTGTGILIEAIATFFLVLVIFGTAVDRRAPAAVFPLAIGLTIALDIMAIGPLTGGAMNPARAFGPALASGHWSHHLVYWVGPLIGAGFAALVQHGYLMKPSSPPPRS